MNFEPAVEITDRHDIMDGIALGVQMLGSELKEKINAFKQTSEELEKSNNELAQYNYITTHDLKSPLNSLVSLSRLIKSEPENREQYLELFEELIGRMSALIDNLLLITETRFSIPEPVAIDFQSLFDELISFLRVEIENHKVKVELELLDEKVLISDQKSMAVILRNLISNAIRYKRENTQGSFVKIIVSGTPDGIQILVRDNGLGMSDELVASAFAMFAKGENSKGGTGLGLFIVRTVLDKIGGTIRVESELGKGTSFFVEIKDMKGHVFV